MQGCPCYNEIQCEGLPPPSNMFLFFFQYSDMNDEMRTEAMELCVTACEKFSANNEVCWAYSLSGW